MQIGADGNLYAVIWGGGSSHILGLSTTEQSGGQPLVVMNQAISGNWGSLAAYNDGLVFEKSGLVKYISYTGEEIASIEYANAPSSSMSLSAATLSGTVFVDTKADTVLSSGCSDPNTVDGTITAITPDSIIWSTPLDVCSRIRSLRPSPNGGVVATIDYTAPTSYTTTTKVVAYSSAGSVLWAHDYGELPYESFLATSVDTHGNVAVQYNKMVNYKYPEIQFALYDGETGSLVPGAQFALRGNSSGSGPSYMWANYAGDVATGKDTAYVVARQCTTKWNCPNSSTKLYAFSVPGLEMDYPRGAILEYDTWLNYVALGDSYSSGQGVAPYEPGTENSCARSRDAYSRLLSRSPAMKLNLRAFVACSGAVSSNVINDQVNALTSNTDIVTITIGGNDIEFASLVKACVDPREPDQPDCTQGTAYATSVYALENYIPLSLDTTFAAIKAKIGVQTRVLVVGYPLLIPAAGVPTNPLYCITTSAVEKTAARGIVSNLNQATHDAVARAGNQFEFIDPNYDTSPFKGHELCNDGSDFNGVVPPPGNEKDSYHPNAAGQEAYRQIIADYLSQ